MLLDLHLNISQMFQFYFREKFDVLRMFRLLVSSRYRRHGEKNATPFGFICFIYLYNI